MSPTSGKKRRKAKPIRLVETPVCRFTPQTIEKEGGSREKERGRGKSHRGKREPVFG
jgi:hypothetical protein